VKEFLRKILKRLGLELIRCRTHVEDILTKFDFDVVLDVERIQGNSQNTSDHMAMVGKSSRSSLRKRHTKS